ncbi:MAG: magnesium transporter CorA, partial [Lachnospiraceae bacterium]|nr:magnesium transporter CorA [Lachnospiraceae bacterium]
MYYLIQETLTEVAKDTIKNNQSQYVALLTSEEWAAEKESFDMGIDIELDLQGISATKAEVNYDSLTGSFCIPDRKNISGSEHTFSFALDEKGIVFIDDSGTALSLLQQI